MLRLHPNLELPRQTKVFHLHYQIQYYAQTNSEVD